MRKKWLEAEQAYLTKRFNEHIPASQIASELYQQFNIKRQVSVVQAKIDELSVGHSPTKKNSKRIDQDPAPTVAYTEALKAIASTRGGRPALSQPALVRGLRSGQKAYLPGIGPVVSLGEQSVSGDIYNVKAIGLEEINPSPQKKKIYVLLSKFAGKNIREMNSADNMDAALAYLEKGVLKARLPQMTSKRKIKLDELINSGNVLDVAEVMIRSFRTLLSDGQREYSLLDLDKGKEALHIFASEYAFVKKQPFEKVVAMIKYKMKENMLELPPAHNNLRLEA